MSWQKCPVCRGLGTVLPEKGTHPSSVTVCSCCNGKKIISAITGLPPKYPTVTSTEFPYKFNTSNGCPNGNTMCYCTGACRSKNSDSIH